MTATTDLSWGARYALIGDNRLTFNVWLTNFPNKVPVPTVESRPEGVWVFLANIDDLAVWAETAGGLVERGPEFAGMYPWTLTVDTGPEYRGLIVHVSALALTDAQVIHTLTDAARLVDSPRAVAA